MSEAPTIAAIATGPAAGGIGVIRISGPRALDVVRRVCPALSLPLPPRVATLARFVDASGAELDEGLVLSFPAPHSYTGDDVVELQGHGAPRGLSLILEHALAVPGVRLAEPGEFTKRAYVSGRIDLAKAEAVADLIAADSAAAVHAAAAQLLGGLSTKLDALRGPLVALRADLEAALDFPEEADADEAAFEARLRAPVSDVGALLDAGASGALLRRGAKVVLYGPVNAGKSSLFNALVGASRAIVDAEPGTTRDVLEARVEWSGLSVTLVDTAGLRDVPGRLEALGISRAKEAVASADLAVLVIPPDASAQATAAWRHEVAAPHRLDVFSKADLAQTPNVDGRLAVSAETGVGLGALRTAVLQRLLPAQAQSVLAMSERHLACLRRAHQSLERAEAAIHHSTLEVVSGEVGLALAALSELTGDDASTELLDAIFQRFCIGK